MKIGSRALDILIMLVEHSPQLVCKRDLVARVWGKSVVEEGTIRFSVAALRKVLSGDESSFSYVATVRGRGYAFVHPVTWTSPKPTLHASAPPPTKHLPGKPLLMVGRDDAIAEISRALWETRFVSIVGAGGIGKTTVALAVAHQLTEEFHIAAHFIDLATTEDSRLVAATLASELGISVLSDQAMPPILAFLRNREVLLVLDSCEHLIERVATLAESIFREAPRVHILATSREALRAESEQVHHLPSLTTPPADAGSLTARDAIGFSAVQLFVKQVINSGHRFELNDTDAPVVAEICRRLDGIPLALELAACRVGVYGIQGTASLLNKQFRLWRGRRTSLPRHQTLTATLDWSYNLLSEAERLTLRRVSVFVGAFSLEAALEVVAAGVDPADVTETLATLVEKSLVTLEGKPAKRYRLLDTTRDYAWRKLAESGEAMAIARRHCDHMVRALEGLGATIWSAPRPENAGFFAANLSNIRGALEWCFSDEGDHALAIRLAAASSSLFFQMSLLPECVRWTECAIMALDLDHKGTRLEAELQACFALAFMVTKGNVVSVRAALVRALEVAEGLDDVPMQLLLLFHGTYKWQLRSGDFRGLNELSARLEAVARRLDDPFADSMAHAAAANTAFLVGDKRQVPALCRMALAAPVHSSTLNVSFGHWNSCGVNFVFPRALWLLGRPADALQRAKEAVQEATDLDRPFTTCYVLMSVIVLFLETGRLESAEDAIHRLLACSDKYWLLTYSRAAVGCRGWLAVLRGQLLQGIELLQTALASLREDGYELYRPHLSKILGEAIFKSGHWERAYRTVCEAIAWCETCVRTHEKVDLLRLKGEILAEKSPREGEACLLDALRLAHHQALLSLELRIGISLANLWRNQGLPQRALELLSSIYARFPGGSETRDLIDAADLLDELRTAT